MLTTKLTTLLGCAHPLQLAPMGTVGTPELAAAVANAGGIGMLATTLAPPPAVNAMIAATRALTEGPIGANFLIPLMDRDCLDVAIATADVIDFFFGDPDAALVEAVHARGKIAAWQCGSADEALAAERAGCDFVTVQGVEAGGRSRGDTALLPLLSQTLARVSLPVVAAGGIVSARGVAAALAAGASGVRVGTRFIAATESGAHPRYVQAVLDAGDGGTARTDRFSVLWPAGPEPHRVLRSALTAAEALETETAGEMVLGGQVMTLPRFAAPAPGPTATGHVEAMALYAGQGVAEIRDVLPARTIVERLMAEAETLLRAWC